MTWPYDVFRLSPDLCVRDADAQDVVDLAHLSLKPPFPWGQLLYGELLKQRGGGLSGDLAECGVAKGGMSIFLARHAAKLGKKLYAFDSFVGLPNPDPARDNAYFRAGDYASRASRGDLLARVTREIRSRGLQDVVRIIPGYLEDTLKQLEANSAFAFVHIDVDLYRATQEALEFFYPRLAEGGVLAIDDFFHQSQGPARAVEAYFGKRRMSPVLHVSFPYSVVIFKGETPAAQHRRSIDGNRYSLDLLRQQHPLREALKQTVIALERSESDQEAADARLLLRVLSKVGDDSRDIYDYWRALAAYWHDMDSDRPDLSDLRPQVTI